MKKSEFLLPHEHVTFVQCGNGMTENYFIFLWVCGSDNSSLDAVEHTTKKREKKAFFLFADKKKFMPFFLVALCFVL